MDQQRRQPEWLEADGSRQIRNAGGARGGISAPEYSVFRCGIVSHGAEGLELWRRGDEWRPEVSLVIQAAEDLVDALPPSNRPWTPDSIGLARRDPATESRTRSRCWNAASARPPRMRSQAHPFER